jgi:hypothetical protein
MACVDPRGCVFDLSLGPRDRHVSLALGRIGLRLLEIVNAATDENNKVADLIKNIDKLAGAAIKLIKLAI